MKKEIKISFKDKEELFLFRNIAWGYIDITKDSFVFCKKENTTKCDKQLSEMYKLALIRYLFDKDVTDYSYLIYKENEAIINQITKNVLIKDGNITSFQRRELEKEEDHFEVVISDDWKSQIIISEFTLKVIQFDISLIKYLIDENIDKIIEYYKVVYENIDIDLVEHYLLNIFKGLRLVDYYKKVLLEFYNERISKQL